VIWTGSHRADKRALPLADRHYNRQKPGTPQFVPPGRCFVLLSRDRTSLWVSSWPFGEYVKHRWPGAWVCGCYRKEGNGCASQEIEQAVAATVWKWKQPTAFGMVTFIDPENVKPMMRRGKPTWRYSWIKAGFEPDGKTEGGLLAFLMKTERLPAPQSPFESQRNFVFA